jgi:hypothetical protein
MSIYSEYLDSEVIASLKAKLAAEGCGCEIERFEFDADGNEISIIELCGAEARVVDRFGSTACVAGHHHAIYGDENPSAYWD